MLWQEQQQSALVTNVIPIMFVAPIVVYSGGSNLGLFENWVFDSQNNH